MGVDTYSLAAGANTALFPEGMSPSAVNDGMRTVQSDLRTWYNTPAWIQYGKGDGAYTAAYVSASSFSIADADVTGEYHADRRVKITGSITGEVYGLIVSSSYSDPNTTVTVTLDSGALSSETLTVWLSAIPATNSPIPGTAGTLGDIIGYSVGTSGATVPLLSTANTWADDQTFAGTNGVAIEQDDRTFQLWSSSGVFRISDATEESYDNLVIYNALAGTPKWQTQVVANFTAGVELDGTAVTSVATSSFADDTAATTGTSTTVVMNPATTKAAIADDNLLIGDRTSAGTANATDEVVVKLTGGGLRRVAISAIKTLLATPDYTDTGATIPTGAGIYSWTHSLGAEPTRVEVLIRCTDAGGDLNYAEDDALVLVTSDSQSNQQTVSVGRNATTVWAVVPAAIAARNKSTYAPANIDKSKWALEVRCWL